MIDCPKCGASISQIWAVNDLTGAGYRLDQTSSDPSCFVLREVVGGDRRDFKIWSCDCCGANFELPLECWQSTFLVCFDRAYQMSLLL